MRMMMISENDVIIEEKLTYLQPCVRTDACTQDCARVFN